MVSLAAGCATRDRDHLGRARPTGERATARIGIYGLCAVVVHRRDGQTTVPAQAPVTVLMLNESGHRVSLDAGGSSVSDVSALTITARGAGQGAPVGLVTGRKGGRRCAADDAKVLEDIGWLADMSRVSSGMVRSEHMTGTSDIVRARITLVGGRLICARPPIEPTTNTDYATTVWRLDGATPAPYAQVFADSVWWEAEGDAVLDVDGLAGARQLTHGSHHGSGRITNLPTDAGTAQSPSTLPHFAHYYDLLETLPLNRPIPAYDAALSKGCVSAQDFSAGRLATWPQRAEQARRVDPNYCIQALFFWRSR